jgi:DNA-binding transcriptional LysR family regulator
MVACGGLRDANHPIHNRISMAVTLTQLRAFVAVARHGSVQGAATHLFVSQPSVSAALAALEREVGLDLLERHGRGVRLTVAGRAYLPYAAEVLGLLEQGGRAAHEAEQPAQARIRVAAVNTAGEYVLPAAHPGLPEGRSGERGPARDREPPHRARACRVA